MLCAQQSTSSSSSLLLVQLLVVLALTARSHALPASSCDTRNVCTAANSECVKGCCQCLSGYEGNGLGCFMKGSLIVIQGTLKGNLNGLHLDNLEVHGDVHTNSKNLPVSFTISSVPAELGAQMTLLEPLVTTTRWLFASDTRNEEGTNTSSGLALTGGRLTRNAHVYYKNSNDQDVGFVHIKQTFKIEEKEQVLKMDTTIEGNLPSLPQPNGEYQVIRQPAK